VRGTQAISGIEQFTPADELSRARSRLAAQSTPTVTATCKDGTAFTGTKRSGACLGHGGVQSWGATSMATSPVATPPS
jgi:Protein of unknown function (DUF3761)